jgi:RNA polymerase sigma-54 factor
VPATTLRAEQRQSQTLSPRLQHAVRLLQMSSLDFATLVRDSLGRNPFLEADDAEAEDEDADGRLEASAEAAAPQDVPDDFDGSSDRDLWQADGGSGLRPADDSEISAMDMMAVETLLNTHLHGQLDLLNLPERDLALAHAIVESLDDDGYLRTPLDELLAMADLDPPASLAELQIALRRVQSLEPSGVGARNVCECLLLQLPAIECPHARALARTIVTDQLPRLAARDVAGLARELDQPLARIEEICDRIRHLDPRPGWRLGSSQVACVVPDVIVRKLRGQWTVQLNPAVVPRVRLNQVCAELFQRHRTAQDAELATHLNDARWTLRNVELRFSTILDVARAIVRRQRHFLDYGAMAMKPLALREIADEVGIHESTVSRVTNNKYMATPVGVFELKYFFSRAMVSANGSACSGTAIRGLVQGILRGEDPARPLSDVEITRHLAQQGLKVARRTVTKYRQMLHIEAVERRRRHAGRAGISGPAG